MATLAELTVQVLSTRTAVKDMSLENLQKEIFAISKMLKAVDEGSLSEELVETATEESKPQKLNLKQFFKKDEVVCIICNKGFKTLKRHLKLSHGLKPAEYKAQFGIPSKQLLSAKSYTEACRKLAIEKGLGEGLAKARAAKTAETKNAVPNAPSAIKSESASPAKNIAVPKESTPPASPAAATASPKAKPASKPATSVKATPATKPAAKPKKTTVKK